MPKELLVRRLFRRLLVGQIPSAHPPLPTVYLSPSPSSRDVISAPLYHRVGTMDRRRRSKKKLKGEGKKGPFSSFSVYEMIDIASALAEMLRPPPYTTIE